MVGRQMSISVPQFVASNCQHWILWLIAAACLACGKAVGGVSADCSCGVGTKRSGWSGTRQAVDAAGFGSTASDNGYDRFSTRLTVCDEFQDSTAVIQWRWVGVDLSGQVGQRPRNGQFAASEILDLVAGVQDGRVIAVAEVPADLGVAGVGQRCGTGTSPGRGPPRRAGGAICPSGRRPSDRSAWRPRRRSGGKSGLWLRADRRLARAASGLAVVGGRSIAAARHAAAAAAVAAAGRCATGADQLERCASADSAQIERARPLGARSRARASAAGGASGTIRPPRQAAGQARRAGRRFAAASCRSVAITSDAATDAARRAS